MDKIFSLLLSGAYLVACFFYGDPTAFLLLALFLLPPIACIWFAEEIASFLGAKSRPGRGLLRVESPTLLIQIVGWGGLLIAPIIPVIAHFLQN